MQGTRLPDATMGKPGPGWDAWERRGKATYIETIAPPGSYMKVLVEGRVWCWYVRAPNGDVASLAFQNHQVEEHEDGTITVSPSIVFPHGGKWHGFLRNGIWSGA